MKRLDHPSGGPGFLLISLATWMAGATVFRWDLISSDFGRLTLAHGDGRLLTFIHEHWIDVLAGEVAWRSPAMFYPAEGVLGYSEACLLTAAIYAPLRWLGLTDLVAMQTTWIVLSLVGFVGFALLVRRYVGAPTVLAMVAASLFTFSNGLHAATPQPQLTTVYLLPWLLLGFLRAIALAPIAQGKASAIAGLCGLTYGLLFSTAFYVAWFSALAGLVITACALLHTRTSPKALWRHFVRPLKPVFATAALGFALGLIPFLLIYGPMLLDGHARSRIEALNSTGRLTDLINTGRRNLVWGELLARLPGYPTERLSDPNAYRTTTPVLLLTALCGGAALVRKRPRTLTAALVTSMVVIMLLPLRIGDHTLWQLVWTLVPGATAIRLVWRLQLLTAAIATFIAAMVLCGIARRPGPMPRITVALLSTLLLAEQVNLSGWAHLDLGEERAALALVPEPPQECTAFVLTDEVGIVHQPQVFALHLASHLDIPTVNGYSGFSPPGWTINTDPTEYILPSSEVLDAAASWLAHNEAIDGVCHIDLPTARWTVRPFESPWRISKGTQLDFQAGASGTRHLIGSGWSFPEEWGRWTEGPTAELILEFDESFDSQRPIELEFEVGAFVSAAHTEQHVRVEAAGRVLAEWLFKEYAPSLRSIELADPNLISNGPVTISFKNLNPTSPIALGLGEDPRVLGLSLISLRATQP